MALTQDQQVGIAFLAYLVIPIVILLLVWLWAGLRRLFHGPNRDQPGEGD